jgi:hypothetical protein
LSAESTTHESPIYCEEDMFQTDSYQFRMEASLYVMRRLSDEFPKAGIKMMPGTYTPEELERTVQETRRVLRAVSRELVAAC